MNKESLSQEQIQYWEKVYREAPVTALAAIKEGAKQLVTITSALQGLYFLAISLSDIRTAIADGQVLLFVLPALPWLVCLGLSISVFVPESHYIVRKPERIEEAFRVTVNAKLRLLRWAQWILVFGMFLLLAEIMIYLVWIPKPVPRPGIP